MMVNQNIWIHFNPRRYLPAQSLKIETLEQGVKYVQS